MHGRAWVLSFSDIGALLVDGLGDGVVVGPDWNRDGNFNKVRNNDREKQWRAEEGEGEHLHAMCQVYCDILMNTYIYHDTSNHVSCI